MRYKLATDGERKNLAVVIDGDIHVTDNSHPYWNEILDAVLSERESEIPALIDLATQAATQFERVTERVAVANGVVTFDGDVVNNSLTEAIARAMRQGLPFDNLARFMDKVYQNPNKHSRSNLYDWLSTHAFTINERGNLVCYKGVSNDLKSISSGPGIVNGEHVSGHLDNSVGNVVEMARSDVQHDPSEGCSVGLHVGTWDYASRFGHGSTLKVEVNPRDVVSVPTDCSWAKMRVCRYRVLEATIAPVESLYDEADDYDDDWGFWNE